MVTAVIVTDHLGNRERVRALKDAHPNVHAVTPWDKPHPHCREIRCPETWLPEDSLKSYGHRCWFKADAMNLAAVIELKLNADFYWFIESDVVARQDRWKALFADHENDRSDCLSDGVVLRKNTPELAWWHSPHTPDWAQTSFLMACYRLSREAVSAGIAAATEMRNVFSEATVASVVKRAGLTHGRVNARQTHWNTSTYKSREWKILRNPSLINHPVKSDSYDI